MTLAIVPQPVFLSPAAGSDMVFVGGLHRSGTSLVARLLAETDDATGLEGTGFEEDEGHYLHDAVRSVKEYGGPGRFGFHPAAHLGPSLEPEHDRNSVLQAFAPYWGNRAASVKVEKSPQYVMQSVWLRSVFPGCRMVMVTRHPATVALATQKWTRPGPTRLRRAMPAMSIEQLMGHWIRCHHLLEQDRHLVNGMSVVRFEDIMDPGSDCLAQLGADLHLASSIERPAPRPQAVTKSYDERWQRWLASTAGRRAARTWLPMAEAAMSKWGYSIDDTLV